jgi:hypothetical protein
VGHLCYASASPVIMPDGTVRLYYGGSSGPHDGVNATTRLGLATLKASDRWVGFRQATVAASATVRVSVMCKGTTLLIGADFPGAASLRVGATSLPGLALADAVELKAVDVHGPAVTAKFKVRRRNSDSQVCSSDAAFGCFLHAHCPNSRAEWQDVFSASREDG